MTTRLTNEEADRIVQADCQKRLSEFVSALQMQRPVSLHKTATLIKHIVMNPLTGDPHVIREQMELDQWEDEIGKDDNLDTMSANASRYFDTEQGLVLRNFFVKIFARTNDFEYPP